MAIAEHSERFVEAALASRPLVVHDDGQQVRCFGHVRDIVGAVVRLMDTPAALGNVINIGSDRPVSIRELAELVHAAEAGVADPRNVLERASHGAPVFPLPTTGKRFGCRLGAPA